MTVRPARFRPIRKHPVISALLALLLLGGALTGAPAALGSLFPPPWSCGEGMTRAGSPPTCVGVDLSGGPLRSGEPARMRELRTLVRVADAEVTGRYTGVVLLLDLTPVSGVDTVTYPQLYSNVEGAVTAMWRANHTAAFGSQPPVKLFLANMGSRYASWAEATRRITANRAAHHLDTVVGLGESTSRTRAAAAYLTAHDVAVVGATVTGDSMNRAPGTGRPMDGFFRVSPDNTDTVAAAARFVDSLHPWPSSIAIVEDTVAGDDYTTSLTTEANKDLKAPGRTVRQLPYASPTSALRGVERSSRLVQLFHLMHANLCQARPQLVYFAGRGDDLGAFLESVVQGADCGLGAGLRVVTGDDGAQGLTDPAVTRALATGKVSLYITTLASPDQWTGTGCDTGVKNGWGEFWSAFTGLPDPCTGQWITASGPGSTRPAFEPVDLNSGQAMLSHDATVAAIQAARDGALPGAPAGTPPDARGALRTYHCASMLSGAGGWIAFGPDGDAVDKPVPVVAANPDGSVTTQKLEWPDGELLDSPKAGDGSVPGC